MGIWCYTCKVINTKLFSSVGVAPRSHLSSAWVLIIPLKLTELHLLSNIPLISEDSQDLIPKGKYSATLTLRKTTVEYAHTEPHGGCDCFGGTLHK